MHRAVRGWCHVSHYELLLLGEFSAAHRLRMHDGNYESLHGHNWRVEVYIEGDKLDSAGLLADFTVLQPRLSEITRQLHDTYLNELPAFAKVNPSTEAVARHIHDRFAEGLPTSIRVAKVRVWETSGCAAAYVPG
jgi:6-pyruvoyltetrahydropterin/6-carboxytetrahydropterin synthase